MKAQIKKQNPFKVQVANELYKAEGENNSWCSEYGVDTNGKIYFHYMNGVTERFTRREYIKRARDIQERNF